MSHVRRIALLLTALAVPSTAAPAAAQEVPPPGTSTQDIRQQIESGGLQGQILEQIRSRGMTPDQVRQMLAQRGYDPSLLDPYLDETRAAPEPTQNVLSALEALGFEADRGLSGDSLRGAARDSAREMLLPDSTALERERGLRVFGLRTFRQPGAALQPVTTGPVPPGYVVGPGDELILILTGGVEASYQLPVTREGFVVIPQVGQVWVNGLTLDEIRDQLYTHLGRAFSGISRSEDATTRFQLSLGQLRPNQVFVTGEVGQPGTYIVSAVASALNALYLAKGPMPNGSFRDIRVMRNGELAHRIDLYAHLLQGDNFVDTRLDPGDVIFVPARGAQVSVHGQVGRPAIYEMRPDETIVDLIRFAGGLNAPAQVGRARIERILPPDERTEAGVDRVVMDVDLAEAMADPASAPTLRAGDRVTVFPVRSELRRAVTIRGAVWADITPTRRDSQPTAAENAAQQTADRYRGAPATRTAAATGTRASRTDTLAAPRPLMDRRDRRAEQARADSATVARQATSFHYVDGMRLWDLIDLAGGLRPDAYTRRAQILRLDPSDSTRTMIPVSLERDADGNPVENPELREADAVRVFVESDFTTTFPVTITGEVRQAVADTFTEGMTLRDLILRAGGLKPTADLTVEVARLAETDRSDRNEIAEVIQVRVDSSYFVSDQDRRHYLGDIAAEGAAAEFELRPYDRVRVRPLAELEFQRSVELRGEVRYPGQYTLQRKDERLSALLERAGGLTNTAYAGGFRLYRDSTLVNVDLVEVLEGPGSSNDIVLLPGDSMFIPEYNPVVLVRGAVNATETVAVLYREGAGLEYYIDQAGGYARFADRDNVNIRYANGEGAAVDQFLLFKMRPEPLPGSTIIVPALRAEDRINWPAIIGDVAQVAGTLTTLLLLISRF